MIGELTPLRKFAIVFWLRHRTRGDSCYWGLYAVLDWSNLRWITDPREATGHCASVLGSSQIFDGTYPATATGGVSLFHCECGPINGLCSLSRSWTGWRRES